MIHIIKLINLDFCLAETLILQVFSYNLLRSILQIRRHLSSLLDAHFDLNIFYLTLFQSIVNKLRYTRTLLERNLNPYLITFNLLSLELDIRKKTLLPEAL